jgi:hypothetical protein
MRRKETKKKRKRGDGYMKKKPVGIWDQGTSMLTIVLLLDEFIPLGAMALCLAPQSLIPNSNY